MNDLEYTNALPTFNSTSVRFVLPNYNDLEVIIVYRNDTSKAYVYTVSSTSDLDAFVRGYDRATSKGRYVNDWTLGRMSDRVVTKPHYIFAKRTVSKSTRASNDTNNLWKGVFFVGDAEVTLTKHVPAGEDPQATLLDEARKVVTKGEPRYKELSRSFV